MKKEEAVVNTGSVDAFVKQTISGVLDVTVEVPATTAPTDSTKDKYVKLTQKEFGALEAGSTLAWVPTGSAHKPGVTIGMGIDGKINDDANTTENEDNHAFVPDVTGLYVFRRAVQKTDGTFDDKSFDYVAYYYDSTIDGGTYFKVYALKVDEQKIYKEGDTYEDAAREGEKVSFLNAGELKAEPIYTYSKLVNTVANKQDMYYETYTDSEGKEQKRLKVIFKGQDLVDQSILNNLPNGKSAIYDAYNAYETKNLGETVYDDTIGSGTYPAFTVWNSGVGSWPTNDTTGDGNATGLTTYDIYNQDIVYSGVDKAAHNNLDNFGLTRLTALQGQTNTALKNAETKATDNSTTENYYDLEDTARTARRVVNEGRDAAADLATYLADVYAAIGEAIPYQGASATDRTSGLYLENIGSGDAQQADTFIWHAKMISSNDSASGIVVPTYRTNTGTETDKTGLDDPSGTNPDGFVAFAYEATNGTTATKMAFATNSDGLDSGALVKTMTADNVNERRFADPGSTVREWPTADNAGNTETGYGVKWQAVTSPAATTAGLADEWDAYVYHTRRLVLNLKKQELVQQAKATGVGVKTDTGRSLDECDVYLEALVEEQQNIEAALKLAKKAYEDAANDVRSKIDKMNECQEYVDAANAKYNSYFGTSVAKNDNDATTVTYDAKPSSTYGTGENIKNVTAAKVVNSGTEDTPDENKLENKLIRIFGVAEKDDSYKYDEYRLSATDASEWDEGTTYQVNYASTFDCQEDPDHNNHVSDVGQTPHFTYSAKATKTKIDDNLETKETGAGADGTTSFKTATTYTETQQNQIMDKPYWKDYVTDKMTKFRTKEKDDAYAAYQNLLEANAMQATQQQVASNKAAQNDIILHINLANVQGTTGLTTPANEQWQYVGDSVYTDDGVDTNDVSAKDFVFGYTGILESGEASSILIKSVEFDKDVKQDAFKELKFDIDVALESAQAIYEGQEIKSDAAKASISVIEPSEERYANSDATVTWVAEGTAPNPDITDNDPQPKDKEVAPTAYTNCTKAIATPVEITPKTVDNAGTDITFNYAVVVDGITYYGEDKKDGTTYYALNEDETAVTTRTFNLAVNP